ncbi:MAG TPA: YbaB/EbfC family nucleoid-associated protein [bacterium]|nr:YbaB/EbfC family nucleoid-associated protein [bacterium]HPN32489.1 YbaB/EbfC family nucleoid-associated protein [bacterium]
MSKKFHGGMGGGMPNLMKQAKKMQEDLMKAQDDLKSSSFEGTSAGGMVKLVLSGDGELKSVKLNKDIVDPNDVELLEDSIVAAFQDGHKKLSQASEQNFGSLTKGLGGLNIPGLF